MKGSPKQSSLTGRLAAAMWIVSAFSAFLTIILAVVLIMQKADDDERSRILAEDANLQSLGFIDLISLNDFQDIVPRISKEIQRQKLNEILRIYDVRGQLVYTNSDEPDLDEVRFDRRRFLNRGFYEIQSASRRYLARVRSYQTLDGDLLWIEIATRREKWDVVLRQLAAPFVLLFSILMVVSFFTAFFVTRTALKPLGLISRQIDDLDVSQFKSWLPLSRAQQSKEIVPIITKFNELLRRIQSSFLRFHNLSRFLSHEIKTPLTIIRGEIETMLMKKSVEPQEYEATLRSALEEVSRIDEIVNTVLRLNPSTGRMRAFTPKAFSLADAIKSFLPSLEALFQRTIQIEIPTPELPMAFTDRELFILLLSNLVRNIFRHTSKDVSAKIKIQPGSNPNYIVIEILDNGKGLSEEQLKAANDQSDESESLGVGISLCKQIAQVAHYQLTFTNRTEGGLCVSILCPTSPT